MPDEAIRERHVPDALGGPVVLVLAEEDSSKSLDMVPASRHTDGVMVYGCNCKPKPHDNRLRGTACGVQ